MLYSPIINVELLSAEESEPTEANLAHYSTFLLCCFLSSAQTTELRKSVKYFLAKLTDSMATGQNHPSWSWRWILIWRQYLRKVFQCSLARKLSNRKPLENCLHRSDKISFTGAAVWTDYMARSTVGAVTTSDTRFTVALAGNLVALVTDTAVRIAIAGLTEAGRWLWIAVISVIASEKEFKLQGSMKLLWNTTFHIDHHGILSCRHTCAFRSSTFRTNQQNFGQQMDKRMVCTAHVEDLHKILERIGRNSCQ